MTRTEALAAVEAQVSALEAERDTARAAFVAAIGAIDDQIAAAWLAFEAEWPALNAAEEYQRSCRRWQNARRDRIRKWRLAT